MRLPMILAMILAPSFAKAGETVVFAAASLKTVLDQVAENWQAQTGNVVTLSYAGSNALAKQIINGAPADIFVSAATNWMDSVEAEDLVSQRAVMTGNSLVLIGQHAGLAPLTIDPKLNLKALLGGGNLAMGMVDSVPAGQYGKAALQNLGLWDGIADQVVQTENVRAALGLVEMGEAPMGIVYGSDAMASGKVTVLADFPETSHDPITYSVALLQNGTDAADLGFYKELLSPESAAIFAAAGFSPLK